MTLPKRQRSSLRQPKRLKLATGQSTVFTLDIGEGGLCFECMKTPARSSVVRGTVNVAGVDFAFEGLVAWTVAGDPRVNQRGRCGVRFTQVSDGFAAALKLSKPPTTITTIGVAPAGAAPGHVVEATRGSSEAPSITLQGDIWVVRSQNAAGRVQEYRCAKEAQARQLFAALRR